MWRRYFLAATVLGSFVLADLETYGSSRLQFEDDGTFKLSILEDLHFGEGESNRTSSIPLSLFLFDTIEKIVVF